MLTIFADSFLTATLQDRRRRDRWNAPAHWRETDLPFQRKGRKGDRDD